ncbi:PREDICTED: anthranilate synthase alpha subunit 1, chloroplastic-like [Populus euphratica]|uniref:Anthranilate synthase alpha subunit 1, chloroplastic-like n=1 Tax=Populus euphratica TaxID=75702 RepID=A0AAJ6V7H6_POPEU|nr:PREDICTED: anthranilate synthase alpha subunit 1, chloroplastic-like [Populus euphratica]
MLSRCNLPFPSSKILMIIISIVIQVKAMELIDPMEVSRRGPYNGGLGGVSYTGDLDIALALGTMVFPTGTQYNTIHSYKDAQLCREWIAYLQAGAGMVAESVPEDVSGLARAIDLAESTFVNKS